MRYPTGYIFDDPGFPSLLISYKKTNDFFFSGHVGAPIIIGLEFYHFLGNKWIIFLCLFSSLFEAFVMVVYRGHYCIDLVVGLVCAHYIFMMYQGADSKLKKYKIKSGRYNKEKIKLSFDRNVRDGSIVDIGINMKTTTVNITNSILLNTNDNSFV